MIKRVRKRTPVPVIEHMLYILSLMKHSQKTIYFRYWEDTLGKIELIVKGYLRRQEPAFFTLLYISIY